MTSSRLFAVIPAAGLSRRMGQPKLLLPYCGTTIIGQLLQTLSVPEVTAVCVVTRPDDVPLRQAAAAHSAWVVSPESDPPDMRTSVEFALDRIAATYQPTDDDGWLLIPADHLLLSRATFVELLAAWDAGRPTLMVPTHAGRRGHPTFFRWSTVAAIREIPRDRGLNWLLERFAADVREIPSADPSVTQDLDTPDDYQRLLQGS